MTQSGYIWRKLTPSQVTAIQQARAAGVSARALACEYGVDVRTIYRRIAETPLPHLRVIVADWVAEFIITPDGPIRVTGWVAR